MFNKHKDLGMITIGAIPLLGSINYSIEYALRETYSIKSFVSTTVSNAVAVSATMFDGVGAAAIAIGHPNYAATMLISSALLKTAAYISNTKKVRESLTEEYNGFFPFGTVIKSWINKESSENALESMLDSA